MHRWGRDKKGYTGILSGIFSRLNIKIFVCASMGFFSWPQMVVIMGVIMNENMVKEPEEKVHLALFLRRFVGRASMKGKLPAKGNGIIGPHNENVISALVASLLGDSWGEKRGNSSRFHVHISTKNMEYLLFLHKFFSDRQYCSENRPKVVKQLGKGGISSYSARFRTYSYTSLNWLRDLFYPNGVDKRVPPEIGSLLTPQALAIWFMDNGGTCGTGCRIATHCFPRQDVKLLREALTKRYGLHCSIQKQGVSWTLYFTKGELSLLSSIIKPLMVTSMHYKLNSY